jgi:hypothetical protein
MEILWEMDQGEAEIENSFGTDQVRIENSLAIEQLEKGNSLMNDHFEIENSSEVEEIKSGEMVSEMALLHFEVILGVIWIIVVHLHLLIQIITTVQVRTEMVLGRTQNCMEIEEGEAAVGEEATEHEMDQDWDQDREDLMVMHKVLDMDHIHSIQEDE